MNQVYGINVYQGIFCSVQNPVAFTTLQFVAIVGTLAVKDYLDGMADEYQRKCSDGELGKCSSKPKEIILHFFGGFYIFCLVV